MATFSALQTRVQRRVIDLPAAVTAEVPDLIAEAHREMQWRHNFKCMETLGGPYTTTVATHVLQAVPSDYKQARGDAFYVEADGTTRDVVHAATREAILDAYSYSDTDEIGPPRFLLQSEPSDVNASNFEVYPYPDGNSDQSGGEYVVYIPYWRFLPTLSADGDSDYLTDIGDRWLIARATAEAFFLNWDEERGIAWMAKAEDEFRKIVTMDRNTRLGGVRHLVPHRGARGPKLRFH